MEADDSDPNPLTDAERRAIQQRLRGLPIPGTGKRVNFCCKCGLRIPVPWGMASCKTLLCDDCDKPEPIGWTPMPTCAEQIERGKAARARREHSGASDESGGGDE